MKIRTKVNPHEDWKLARYMELYQLAESQISKYKITWKDDLVDVTASIIDNAISVRLHEMMFAKGKVAGKMIKFTILNERK